MEKKKILVIGPGMELGGVERSLIGLLDAFDYTRFDVDLFLFHHTGSLMSHINPKTNILPENTLIADGYEHVSQLVKHGHWLSALLKCVSHIIGKYNRRLRKIGDDSKDTYQKIVSHLIRGKTKEYDLALGFIDPHYFLLRCVNSKVKVGWMHTDWETIGSRYKTAITDDMWAPLDYVACVSEGVKKSFDRIFPHLSSKTMVPDAVFPT